MLESLVNKGYLKVLYTTPVLRARVAAPPDPDQLDPYERIFVEAAQDDDMLSQEELEAVLREGERTARAAWSEHCQP